MSEGPQVKLRTEWLHARLGGRTIRACQTPREDLSDFARAVTGREVARVFCKGKHIFLEFEGDLFLHNHLLMRGSWRRYDGRFLFLPEGAWLALDLGTATVCNLNGQMLRPESRRGVEQELAQLGPDVMASPYPSAAILASLAASDRPLGRVLLDQAIVCGLGNIAKSEALHAAGIDPRLPADLLEPERAERLVTAMRDVCEASYHKGGRWTCDVYHRHGRACRQCGATIARQRQDGRMTYYCPRCQS